MTDGDLERSQPLKQSDKEVVRDAKKDFPSKVSHEETVKKLSSEISVDEMEKFLSSFTSFRTRYFRSSTGHESGEWLLKHVKTIAKMANESLVSVKVSQFKVPRFTGLSEIPTL